MDKQTGEKLLINNEPVTGEKSFTPKTKSGTLEMNFSFEFQGLSKGDYVVFEEIYLGSELIAEHKDLNDDNQTFSFIEVLIHKISSTSKEPLEGAEFTLYDESGNALFIETTDAQGSAKFFIPVGNYTVEETKAPQGFKLSNESNELVVTGKEVDHTIALTVENDYIPKLPDTGVSDSHVRTVAIVSMVLGLSLLCANYYLKRKETTHEQDNH